MYVDAAAGESAAPAGGLDLQHAIQKTDGIVAAHRALELQREHALQIAACARHEGTARFGCRNLKTAIELGDVALAQEAIGLVQRTASGQAQLLRQAPLPGSEVAFTAAARLWRIGRNHANPQFPQGSPHLGQTMGINCFSRLWSQPEVAAAVTVQGAEDTLLGDHFPQRRQHRSSVRNMSAPRPTGGTRRKQNGLGMRLDMLRQS
jgi:hypothetical protein